MIEFFIKKSKTIKNVVSFTQSIHKVVDTLVGLCQSIVQELDDHKKAIDDVKYMCEVIINSDPYLQELFYDQEEILKMKNEDENQKIDKKDLN